MNLSEKKSRYLSDPVPVRLGGLAANLARIRSFSSNPANQNAVFDLFEESKYFIEWTAPESEIETALELIELQLVIAGWQRRWKNYCADETVRNDVAQESARWSSRILQRSGLLVDDGK